FFKKVIHREGVPLRLSDPPCHTGHVRLIKRSGWSKNARDGALSIGESSVSARQGVALGNFAERNERYKYMKQNIPKSMSGLQVAGQYALGGVAQFGPGLGLVHN